MREIQANEMVVVKSMVNAIVLLKVQSINLRREWNAKGSIQRIRFEDLEVSVYEPGVRNMFDSGTLYIEDMAAKQRLGLEPEEAVAPVNIIVFTDKQIQNLLIKGSLSDLEKAVKSVGAEQALEFSRAAVELKIRDGSKTDLLEEVTGQKIRKAIEFKIAEEKAAIQEKANK